VKKEIESNVFTGFYPETMEFLGRLNKNNSKVWFDAHRDEYDEYLLNPVKKFVESMKGFLNYIDPQLIVEPKFNKSLVRINKDMRFAKKPYKDYFLIRFGRYKWDCELDLVIQKDGITVGAFVNNEKKPESRFYINVNYDLELFHKVCEEYGITKKYSAVNLNGMSEISSKFNPKKDTEKLLDTKWFIFSKFYSPDDKKLFSKKFLEDIIMVYNSLYPVYIYGTSIDLKKDLKDYKNKVGILKK
jgi:uncharacterized protein (TIGR02453 family)